MLSKNDIFLDEIESFRNTFKSVMEKKIVLYGIGRKTDTLLPYIKDFNIVGLCDRDENLIGTYKYGLPIIDKKTVEEQADLVIINTMGGYWYTIYSRIKDWNVPIFYRDGTKPEYYEKVDERDKYWELSSESVEQIAVKYDVISFDLFDTLIMRRVTFPKDIYDIVENKVELVGFAEKRKNVELDLYCANIYEIYEELKKCCHIEKSMSGFFLSTELQVEKKMLVPRNDMIRLLKNFSATKEVCIVSDMYLNKKILCKWIEGICGVQLPQERIFISNELRGTKKDGTIWRELNHGYFKGKKVLHIGDDEQSDYFRAKENSIDAIIVRSARKMCETSSIKNMMRLVNNVNKSVGIGLIISKIFNSPFALGASRGKVFFHTPEMFGYCLLGGAVYTFCDWLYKSIYKNGLTDIVFLGRDGYLMKPQFDKYLNEKKICINTYYIESSRKVLWLANIKTEMDIWEVANAISYSGTYSDFFSVRFNVKIDDIYASENYVNGSPTEKYLIEKYKEQILKNAESLRTNYLRYLYDFDWTKKKFAVVDLSFYGSIQYYLGKLLQKEVKGYYWCANLSESNVFNKLQSMDRCYGNHTPDGWNSNFMKRSLFMEAFYTSPNGMLSGMECCGQPIYDEAKSNQKFFEVREFMQRGIFEFIQDACELEGVLKVNLADADFWDDVFETLMDEGFVLDESIKKGFYRDDVTSTNKEYRVWE